MFTGSLRAKRFQVQCRRRQTLQRFGDKSGIPMSVTCINVSLIVIFPKQVAMIQPTQSYLQNLQCVNFQNAINGNQILPLNNFFLRLISAFFRLASASCCNLPLLQSALTFSARMASAAHFFNSFFFSAIS